MLFFIAVTMTITRSTAQRNRRLDNALLHDGITIGNRRIYSEFLKNGNNDNSELDYIYPMYTLEELEYSEGDTFDIHFLSETKLHVTVKFRSNLDIGFINKIAMYEIRSKARTTQDPNGKKSLVSFIRLYIECMKMINIQNINFCISRVLVGPLSYLTNHIMTPLYDEDELIDMYNSTNPEADFHLYKFQLMCLGYRHTKDCSLHIEYLNDGLTPDLEILINETDLFNKDANSFIIIIAGEYDMQRLQLFNEYKPVNTRYEIATFLSDQEFVDRDLTNVDQILYIPFVPRIVEDKINKYRSNSSVHRELISFPFGPRDELETVDYNDPLTRDYNIIFNSKYCCETGLERFGVHHVDTDLVFTRYSLTIEYSTKIKMNDVHLQNIIHDVSSPMYDKMMERVEDEIKFLGRNHDLVRVTEGSFLKQVQREYKLRDAPKRLPFETMFKSLPSAFISNVCTVFTFICENIGETRIENINDFLINTVFNNDVDYFNACTRWMKYLMPYDYMFDFDAYMTKTLNIKICSENRVLSYGDVINGIRQNRFISFDLMDDKKSRTIIVNYFLLQNDYKALKYCVMCHYSLNMKMLVLDPYVWRMFESRPELPDVSTICNMNYYIFESLGRFIDVDQFDFFKF